jgi:hypothetical protein
MSWEKEIGSMERKQRMVLVMRGGRVCIGTESVEDIARWSDMPRSVVDIEVMRPEVERVMSKSRV